MRSFFHSFSGGEVTPEFYSQIADVKFQTGLAVCRNFMVKPHGPVENRPGTAYIAATKYSGTRKSRIISFTYSTTQTMVVELGHLHARFYTQGARLLTGTVTAWSNATAYVVGDMALSGGVNYYCILGHTNQVPPNATYWYPMPAGNVYEIPTPFDESELFDIHYVQSADVLTLTHPAHPPTELRRLGAAKWTLVNIAFTPTVLPPTAPTAVASGGAASYTYQYVITTVGTDKIVESVPTSAATCSNNLNTGGAINTISWTAASGAAVYNVYKYQGGIYGYIGQTDTLSIVDDNITPDLGKTPPTYDAVFQASGDYPGAVSYFEQRRCFAGTTNKPQNIWMTRSGTESAMSYSLPIRDDDRIAFKVAAREANTIRHIVPLAQMILLTSGAEWRVTSVNSDAITPTTISVRPQSYVGSNNVQPVIVNNNLIYAAAYGGHIREMAYNWQAGGYLTGDTSLRAPHLFDTHEITDMTFSKTPYPVVWMVSNNGKMLGFTYVPEQQIGAWHQHDTDGTIESCTVVTENGESALYLIVKRTINGSAVRYVEVMKSRFPLLTNQNNAWFVDCGLQYIGSPATVISGLDHLEGKTVNILADGAVHPQRTVTGGSITLQQAASNVIVGMPIVADIQTLPLAMQIDSGYAQGKPKNVNAVWLRVVNSRGMKVGPDFNHLTEVKQRTTEPYGSPIALQTDEIKVAISPSWSSSGSVAVRQTDPLPLTITGMTLDVEVGG